LLALRHVERDLLAGDRHTGSLVGQDKRSA